MIRGGYSIVCSIALGIRGPIRLCFVPQSFANIFQDNVVVKELVVSGGTVLVRHIICQVGRGLIAVDCTG